jgi:hypothetical protein
MYGRRRERLAELKSSVRNCLALDISQPAASIAYRRQHSPPSSSCIILKHRGRFFNVLCSKLG